ncbi:MAG: hypothetical protein AB8H03_22215 [Saprospiraceae bacterium]
MSDITIKHPLKLNLSVIDAEDVLPSFEMSMTITIPHLSGNLEYRADSLWFECSKWDAFIKDTSLSDTTTSTLESMCESFKIKLTKKQEKYSFSISCKIKTLSKGTFNFEVTYELNRDVFLQISKKFEQFPVWW